MNARIDILEYNGEAYSRVMAFESWRVAMINYAERFDKKNITKMERHLLTDEVFVLLDGEATLLVGENDEKYPMEKNKIYNIKQGEWHAIYVSRDAKVLIVENDSTGPVNSEYRPLKGNNK